MLEIITSGGWLIVPIISCSILALTIITERLWALRRGRVVPDGLGEQVEGWAAQMIHATPLSGYVKPCFFPLKTLNFTEPGSDFFFHSWGQTIFS